MLGVDNMDSNNRSIKQRIERKLFNGYVLEPIPIVVLISIIGMAFIGLSLWATWDILMPHEAIQLAVKECRVVAYHCDGPIYVLESNDQTFFDLPVNAIEDHSVIDSMVLNCTSVVIKYELSKDKIEQSYDVIEIIDMNGDAYISQDVICEARKKASSVSLLIIWSMCLSYFALILSAYYILCNAPKHPRLASLFVRSAYRNF